MVTNENPKNILTIEDVDNSSLKVGIQEGTTSDLYLQDNNYTSEVVSFSTVTLAIAALNAGTVDCVLGDHATLLAGAADTLKVVHLLHLLCWTFNWLVLKMAAMIG